MIQDVPREGHEPASSLTLLQLCKDMVRKPVKAVRHQACWQALSLWTNEMGITQVVISDSGDCRSASQKWAGRRRMLPGIGRWAEPASTETAPCVAKHAGVVGKALSRSIRLTPWWP